MRCLNGKNGIPLTVSSALAKLNENFVEFARPAIERHGIEPGVRPSQNIISHRPSSARHGAVLACAFTGPDGIRACFHREHARGRFFSISWRFFAMKRVPVVHLCLRKPGHGPPAAPAQAWNVCS